jgi:small subunit ribosomal protein S16
VAVKIRLKRLGKIRAPYYRIVVADSRTRRDGRVIEEIGKYHPKEEPSLIEVQSERAQYWLGVGAQPTEAVEAILKVTGDWQRFKGEAGAEGTLKTKQAGKTKQEIFNEILTESGGSQPTEAVTRRSSGGAATAAPAAAAPATAAPATAEASAEAPATAEASAEATAESAGSNEVGAPRESGDAASVVES